MDRLRNNVNSKSRQSRIVRTRHGKHLRIEELEGRELLSASYTPLQIKAAYGVSQLGLANPGAGQTIAIVGAYENPNIQAAVDAFDARYGLPAVNLTVINDGATKPDQTGAWGLETAMDVEWAHALAPYAHIILVEAANGLPDSAGVPTALLHAVGVASSLPGVSVVSMSWGVPEFPTEAQYDGAFSTPGITYLAASGDYGAPIWPAAAPNVVAVGGTSLEPTSTPGIYTETGWGSGSTTFYLGGSGGGFSTYEPVPSYQAPGNFVTSISGNGMRQTPDVSWDGDPQTGEFVCVLPNSWQVSGGTSAATPQWAALIALADQVRANVGQPALTTAQTLSALYREQADFYDVTSGNNGQPAGTGYDLVTGLGTPQANLLVPDLASLSMAPGISASDSQRTGGGPSSGGSNSSNTHYVDHLYKSLLNRSPDSNALAYWSNLLNMGTGRYTVVSQIIQSQEYRIDEVEAVYARLLKRAPDALGMTTFATELANGASLESVEMTIAVSAEYYQTRGQGQTASYLSALFSDALNRTIDPVSAATLGQALASQSLTRSTIATLIFHSLEYNQGLVQLYFQSFLQRQADSSGLTVFANALQQGELDQEVIGSILSSQEYYQL
jgi:subtilase family serine protease